MGLKCRISYSASGQATVTDANGNASKLFADALAVTQDQNAALNIWASAYTPEFQETFGTTSQTEEPPVLQVVKYYQSLKQLDGRLEPKELFEVRQMMRTAGISNLSDFSSTLKAIFLQGDVPGIDENLAIESGLFLPEDLNSIDLPKVVDLIARMEGETLSNDFEVEPQDSEILYRDTAHKNIFGASETVTIEQIDSEVIDLIDNFQSEEEFYDKLQELPYSDFTARFYEDEAFANEYMAKFQGLVKVPVIEERAGELVSDVTPTFSTVKNTILDGLDSITIDADISFINSIADNIWEVNAETVSSVVQEIEAELATKNIDIIGLHSITTDKATLLEMLNAASVMVENPTDTNILAFSQVYDKTFLRQPAKKVAKVPGNLQGLTLVSMYSAKTDQQLFDQHGLIKVGDNLYHKVDLTADISEAYEYLYQQMREGAFQIPYQYRTETNMDNKPAVLQDIAEFVNARETGLGFYNEKASLYQVVFGHPEINLVKESDMATSALSTLTTNEVYLKTDFVSDFYSMILQEKLADSPVYRNTLSKFSVTDNDITLTSDLVSDLTDIPMYQELMDYIKLRKNSSMKKFLPAEMMGDTNEAFSAYNFPTTIAQYTGTKAETQNLVVTPPILDDFIRIEDTVYQKVKVSQTANVFLRLKPNNNSAYYTTTPPFANFTQEQIDRAAQTDMVTNTKLTGKDITARKEKSGVLSRLVNNIKARSASLVSKAQQQTTKAFETNLVEFLRQKGLPVVTDLAEMKAALAELGIDSVNQMFRFQDMGVNQRYTIQINGNKLTVRDMPGGNIKTAKQAYGTANGMFQRIRKYVQGKTGPMFRENMVVLSGTTITLNIPADMPERVQQMMEMEAEIARILEEQKQAEKLEDYNPTKEELERGVSPDVLKDLGYDMLQTPAGTILGFEYKGTIYLDPTVLNNVTTLHELTHVFQALVKARANAGDTQAQKILQKREEVFGAMAREWEVFHKMTNDPSATGLTPLQPGEVAPQFQLGLINLTEQEVLKYGRAGIDNKYEAQAIKQIGLQGTNFDKASIQERIKKETDDLLKRTTDYVFSEDSKAIDGAIQNEIDTMINQGSSNEQVEQAKKALQPGRQRDRVIGEYKKAQLDTIKQWTDYLSQSDYSDAFKYLMLDAVLTNNYNFKTDEYQKRNKKTIRNFTPFDAGTLAELYASESNALLKDYVKIQVENTANIVDTSKFSSTGEGEWLKFNGGSETSEEEIAQNANKLSQLVQNTYWCTKTNAKGQLEDGDFYVYATKNTDGSYSPRVAVRMEGDQVGEVRGNASAKQDLEPEMLPVAEKFLKEEIPNNSGKQWLDSIAYNTKVKDYTEKIKGKTLDLADIREYADILKDAQKYSVDYGENGLVTTLNETIKKAKFSVPVAFNSKEINAETVALIGNFEFPDLDRADLGDLQIITGDAYFYGAKNIKVEKLKSIGGDVVLNESYIEDLGSIETIGGSLYLRGSQVTSLGSLQSIGGDVVFVSSKLENLGALKSIGGKADFRSSKVSNLGALENIGWNAFFTNSSVTDLKNLKNIGGDLDLGGSSVTSLGSLENIGGDAIFEDLSGAYLDTEPSRITKPTYLTTLGQLKSIGRNAYLTDPNITDIGALEYVGGDARFSGSGIRNLSSLKEIGRSAIFRDSAVEDLGKLESIGGNADFVDSKVQDLGGLKSIGRLTLFEGKPELRDQYIQRQRELQIKTRQTGEVAPQFQFIGEGNRLTNNDRAALTLAKQLEADNKTPEEIYQKTNWLKTNQDIWIREIGDLKVIPPTEKELNTEVKNILRNREVVYEVEDLFDTSEIGNRYNFDNLKIKVAYERNEKNQTISFASINSKGERSITTLIKGSEDYLRRYIGGENIGEIVISRRGSGSTDRITAVQSFQSIINHEFQHILQAQDNTRKVGNSLNDIVKFFIRKNISAFPDIESISRDEVLNRLERIYQKEDFAKYAETLYRNSIGERQATEVELRMFDKSTLPENFEGAFNIDTQDVQNGTASFQAAREMVDARGSKIVDAAGELLVVYRSQKDSRKQTTSRQSGMKGIYFSANEESTKIYGDKTKAYYLDIKNPLVLKDTEWNLSLIPEYLYQDLIRKGYDGAVWLQNGEMYEIVAFQDDQVIPIENNYLSYQAAREMVDAIGLDLSAPVYAQRQGESDTDYHNRLVNEVEAYVAAPEIAQKLEELRQTNPSLWSRITDFLKNLTTWLKTQIGLSDYDGDIMNMTKEEYTSALGVSILKEEYDDLFVPNNSNKIANEVINATVVLDSQVEMISLQTEEAQDALYNKIDNCG